LFGLISRMRAQAGRRGELMEILLASTSSMPGCLSYVVAEDATDADAIWITEIWEDEASHKASLSLPVVQAAIGRAKPMIAGFEAQTRTRPLGGAGLSVPR